MRHHNHGLHTAILGNTKKVPYLRITLGSQFLKGAKWIPYLWPENLLPYSAAHTYIAYIWEYPPGGGVNSALYCRLEIGGSVARGGQKKFTSHCLPYPGVYW